MPKQLITKRVSDLTEEDKAQYLTYLKEAFAVNYVIDWDELEPQILAVTAYLSCPIRAPNSRRTAKKSAFMSLLCAT